MAHLTYLPVDAVAKNGAHHLLRDAQGRLHCGRWEPGGFVYSNGQPLGDVVEYMARAG